MTLRPLADKILVEPMPKEQKTASGLYLADGDKKDGPERGVIVATGPGRTTDEGELVPLSVKVGDKVLYTPDWSKKEIKMDEKTYLLMPESEILGIIE